MANHVGELARLETNFTDLDGTATDPDTVTLHVRKPDGTVINVDTANDATAVGRWYGEVSLDQEGIWRYRFVGAGLAAVDQGAFWVRVRRVPAPT